MAKNPGNIDWQPSAKLKTLQIRAQILADIRKYFAENEVLEVETPILSQATSTDPNIESFRSTYYGPGYAQGRDVYLHTSPEFAMKRLLAAGSGAIYQLCKVFRQGELGNMHNPEFTLLEWYRPGFGQYDLMAEIEDLLTLLLTPYIELKTTETISYQQAFFNKLSIDPLSASIDDLRECAIQNGLKVSLSDQQDTDFFLDYLLSQKVQPGLGQQCLTFLVDFPASQSSLACINPHNPQVSERFELFLHGVELANGYHELANAHQQYGRMQQEILRRKIQKKHLVPIDDRFMAALTHGLPNCSGVAVGIDRLILLILKTKKLGDTLSFSFPLA